MLPALALQIWRYCRVHGHYKNTMNGIGLLLSDVAADEHINMVSKIVWAQPYIK